MPINRESQSVDKHGSEESSVRRAPLEDDAYELADHEFTLVADEPVDESRGWPFDEHTAPWSTLPPLPAWATKARELLEPPTLPRPLNDETPTLVEDGGVQFSATALRALREELAQSAREALARREQIEQLERSLASAVQARAEIERNSGRATSELLGRVQGQAARISELETALCDLQEAQRAAVVETTRDASSLPQAASDARLIDATHATFETAIPRERAEAAADPETTSDFTAPAIAHTEETEAEVASDLDLQAASDLGAEVSSDFDAQAASERDAEVTSDLDLQVASELDPEADLETTVEWITNAAPSVEVTIEIDANDDAIEVAGPAADNSERTIEIDPDIDLVDANAALPEPDVSNQPPTTRKRTRSATTKRRVTRRDDLQQIDGIGKRLEARLNAKGIRSFAQLTALSRDDLPRIAKHVGVSLERIAREGWVRQARKLEKQAAKRPVKRSARRRPPKRA